MNFCAIYRNNFSYLSNFLVPTITNLDRFEEFNFYFYTNDSTDGTEELLLLLDQRYKNITTLTKQVGNKYFERGFELERIQVLTHARNQLMSLRPFVNHEWSVFVDSNIYFHSDVFDKFLALEKPQDGAVFSCAGVDYRHSCTIHDDCFAYYDMLAVIDAQGRQGFAIAAEPNFKWSCSFPFLDQQEQDQYNAGLPVEVECAFGGMSFYKTDILNKPDIYYSSDIKKTHALRGFPIYLEHWDLHSRISRYGKIYTIPLKVYRDELGQFCRPL
jgi:hypothetical protein